MVIIVAQTIQNRVRSWLIGTLVAGTVIAAVTAVCTLAARHARRESRHARWFNDLHQIGLALLSFDQARGFLPPAEVVDESGRRLHSWRVELLTFLDSGVLPGDQNLPWTDAANYYRASRSVSVYSFSSDPKSAARWDTNVVAVTGPGTPLGSDKRFALADIDQDTILAIEVKESGLHWMEPGDVDIRALPDGLTEGLDGDGVHVLFADASVWFLSKEVPLDDLKRFFTVEGAKQHDRDQVLAPYRLR